jgi:glycosyltransferase involved in cell wall biosynthesis
MRNLLLINWQDRTNPFFGGAEVHLHEIYGRLAQSGKYKVSLICSAYDGARPEDELDGIRIIRKGGRQTFNLVAKGVYSDLLAAGEKFDLVIEDYNKLPFFAYRWAKCPVLMQVHHFFGKTIYFEAGWPIATFVYLSEKFALNRYRKLPFIAVSESTANELVQHGVSRDKIRIIYNGIRREVFYPDENIRRSETPTIVYLGRIKAYKRVDVLIRAMTSIRERVPGAKLVIIGSGDGIKPLRELADSLSLSGDAINFAGFVSEEQKVKLLRESWIAVNTSPKEGWGIVGMEAQACGTPVVVSDAPGLRESIRDGETGFLFPFGEVSALTEKVTTLLTSSDLRAKMGKSAAVWAHKFTWEKAAEDTDRAIEDLLSGRL